MESLALKHRPKTFEALVGQRSVNVVLRQMVTRNRVPTALLFAGCRGTGKTTTARILAAALNCDIPPGPCAHCVSCKSVYDGSSMDLVEIDAASNGLVDDIRRLRNMVLYSVGGRCRVVVLDEAHSMSGAAFNALLKTLEEPPPATTFVLATTEPNRILDTVLSRCMPFRFSRVAVPDIVRRLADITAVESLTIEPALLHVLAERADGAMRDAVMALDQMTRVGITTVAEYVELMGDIDYGPALLTHITAGNLAVTFDAVNSILTQTGDYAAIATAIMDALRDTLILHSGGDLPHQGEALTTRHRLTTAITAPAAVAALTVMWDLRTKVRATDDPRSNLDLAIVMLTEKLAPPRPTPSPATVASRRLTLAEMEAL